MTSALVPPHDLDAEAAVISAVLLQPEALDAVVDILRAECFYAERHRQIYAAAVELRTVGQPVDAVTVATWLRDRGRIEQVGGMAYVTEVLNAAPVVANIRAYARTVVDRWRLRQVIATCQRIAAAGYLEVADTEMFLAGAEAEIREVTQSGVERTGEFLDKAVRRVIANLVESCNRGSTMIGIPTGFRPLDERMHGLREGTVMIVAARPGAGKSAFALNMAVNIARTTGGYVPFFSLEMSNDEQATREIASSASVPIGVMSSANVTPDTWRRLMGVPEHLKGVNLVLYDETNLTPQALGGKVRRLATEAARAGRRVSAVFVDYLQLMKSPRKTNSREQEVADISRSLKLLAKETKIPFVVLAQLNREVEKGAKAERPKLSHLRESGSIEQDADVVLFIHRDPPSPESAKRDYEVAELIIAKGRNIARGTAKVRFDGAFTRFGTEEIDQ